MIISELQSLFVEPRLVGLAVAKAEILVLENMEKRWL